MITPADFKVRFPEFESSSDLLIQTHINDATPFFEVGRWGDLYDLGLSNFVAHSLAAAAARASAAARGGGGISDSVVSKKVGSVQIQRSEALLMENLKDPFMTTVYGREYKRLVRIVGMGAMAL